MKHPDDCPICADNLFEVYVGNIGKVYSGYDEAKANQHFNEYVAQSKSECGRAGGEQVEMHRGGGLLRNHYGSIRDAED